jgi:hypothetical protein
MQDSFDQEIGDIPEDDPKTIYLKCKKRVFYLYEG